MSKLNPFVSDGRWGFREAWSPRRGCLVFELLWGGAVAATLWPAPEGWRIEISLKRAIACEFDELYPVLCMIFERMRAARAAGAALHAWRQPRFDAAESARPAAE